MKKVKINVKEQNFKSANLIKVTELTYFTGSPLQGCNTVHVTCIDFEYGLHTLIDGRKLEINEAYIVTQEHNVELVVVEQASVNLKKKTFIRLPFGGSYEIIKGDIGIDKMSLEFDNAFVVKEIHI